MKEKENDDADKGLTFGGSNVTRRRFLKRSGGATSASLIAWTLASQTAQAIPPESESESESGPWVLGSVTTA